MVAIIDVHNREDVMMPKLSVVAPVSQRFLLSSSTITSPNRAASFTIS
jgi:hypothetical protein